jgi:hypothetical protein
MKHARSIIAALRSGDWIGPERIRGYSILFLLFSAIAVVGLWTTGEGLLDAWRRPLGTDFANPYSAGQMALAGRAPEAYDYATQYAEQRAIFHGGEDQPFYGWPYPPIFFLAVVPLALLPYVPALLCWLSVTFALYLATIWTILPRRLALLAAAAFPAVFVTITHGHNAFLTAALLGSGLANLERRPWLAGLLLGCLAYKPHLGLVLPLILIAGGHWRAFFGAAIAVAVLCAASIAAFGIEAWYAFLASGEVSRTVLLEQVATGWYKIQSAFSAVRGLGGSIELAYVVQGAVSLAVLAGLAFIWRHGSGGRAKAAACIGTLLVTPYVLDYDLAVLAPAIAFLAAEGIARGLRPYEKVVLAAAWLVPLLARPMAQHLDVPIALIVMTILFVITLRGALGESGSASALSLAQNSARRGPTLASPAE